MTIRVNSQQVLAFRLAGQHLSQRLAPYGLLKVAAACGLQNSPPGSAALALAARVDGLRPAGFVQALEADKTLLQVRSLRGAPHVIPTHDLAIFTSGLLPSDEAELRFFILGAGPALDRAGISATRLVDLTATALLAALDGRVMAFRDLSTELTARVAGQLATSELAAWPSPGGYAAGQSLGEALIHFALYPLALQGLYCYAARVGDEAAFARTDQWLGRPPPSVDLDGAQAELLRRYLSCYGPSTAHHFGAWAGIAPSAAARVWARVQPELVKVDVEGRRAWLQQADVSRLAGLPGLAGVRLLPPHDPYLALRDRGLLLGDVGLQRRVWPRVGNPGVVLAGGRVVALWRPEKKGRRLMLKIEAFTELSGPARSEIASEADVMAAWRDCTSGEVVYAA